MAASLARASSGGSAAVPPIVFPLLSDVPVYDNFGDPRVNGSHEGIDIERAPRRTPVLAAEAGRVQWHTTSARAGCMLYLYGASGTTYLYIHLNNDVTMRNDNRGRCAETAYAVKDQARVTAGELIGWNGDSGDADGNPHLHFEVHPRDGAAVNPLPFLKRAERRLFPGRVGARFTLGLRGNLVGVRPGRLTVRVSAVRWWPNGRWVELGDRIVSLALPPGARLAGQEGQRGGAARGDDADGVTVFTVPARATTEALRGDDGVLRAARIRQRSGAMIEIEPAAPGDGGGESTDDGGSRPGGV